jgi:hypothetical protein
LKTISNKTGSYPYRLLNRIFLSVLILILAYSALFSPERNNHPIPSGSRFFSSATVPSTGLSRSFSAIMRFRFHDAHRFNPHGIRLFLFFFMQLFMRIGALWLASRLPERSLKALYYADALLSATLFIACFWPFLAAFGSAAMYSLALPSGRIISGVDCNI